MQKVRFRDGFRVQECLILLLKVPIPEPDQFAFLFLNLTLTLNFSFSFFCIPISVPIPVPEHQEQKVVHMPTSSLPFPLLGLCLFAYVRHFYSFNENCYVF